VNIKRVVMILSVLTLATSLAVAGGKVEQKPAQQAQPVTSMTALPADAVSAADQVMNYPLLLENGTSWIS
jgi:hypothetical protein